MNKDHYANLGRLNGFWWRWSNDPERLRESLRWYEQVTPIAPQDVTLLNERAGVLVELGNYTASAGDAAQAQTYYDQARELLDHSAELDPNYVDTPLRIADLTRITGGDLDTAAEAYAQAIRLSPTVVTSSIEAIAEGLVSRPDLILKLRDVYAEATATQEAALQASVDAGTAPVDLEPIRAQVALLQTVVGLLSVRGADVPGSVAAYERAVALQPANPTYSRNYSIVLSDTQRIDGAIAETERMLGVLRAQAADEQTISDTQNLLALFQQVKGE